jgi:hypothetical protein
MIGADGEVQRVSSAQAQRMLVREPGRRAKLQPRYRHHGKAVRRQPSKNRQRVGSANGFDLPGSQLDGESGGELRRHSIADCEAVRLVLAEPALYAPSLCLIRQSGDEERRIQVEHQ